MPSQRRTRLLFYGVLILVAGLLFYTSHVRQSRDVDPRTIQDFYHKTKKVMDQRRTTDGKAGHQQVLDKAGGRQDDAGDEEAAKAMAERLRAAEDKAKNNANLKAPRPDAPSKVNGVGSSAGGQGKKADRDVAQKAKETTSQDAKVEEEINSMLKKSPVVIFSKTYCQFSKRAKGILLEKYTIEPTPYVVELDEHPMGAAIQKRLEGMTGRRTVPNVMVNGKSIGGSDEISELDAKKELANKIKGLGGKRVDVVRRFVEDAGKKG